jgi:hypothetical protein
MAMVRGSLISAGAGTLLAPFFDEPAVLGELDDAVVLSVALAVGDENVAIRCDGDVGWLIKQVGART